MTRGIVIALGTVLIVAGCQPTVSPLPAARSPDTLTQASAGTSATTAEIALIKADAKTLAAKIAEHQGQVVFVDFWATWCLPCVEGFPHTVELSKKYKDQGLATIAVSFDNLESKDEVRSFLIKRGANFDNLLSKYDGVSQEAAKDFDVEALPQYRLYDRQGKLRFKWEGQSDEIEPKIKELLAENPSSPPAQSR